MFSDDFSKIVPFMRKCGKTLQSRASQRWQYRARALNSGYLRLQIYTHSGCVILIASPQQQWLHECASLLHYIYIACLVHIQSCAQATVPRGLCSASHVYSSDSWRTVSRVGTTMSGAATLCVSTSIWGTLLDHGHHSRVVILTYVTDSNKC